MARDQVTNDRLSKLLAQLISLTEKRELQLGSAHRYARWKDNLFILGPADPLSETKTPRYLFITPFDSPSCIEINSTDAQLGSALTELVQVVEKVSENVPPTDPFALSNEDFNRLMS